MWTMIFRSDSPGFCELVTQRNKFVRLKQLEFIKKERRNVQEEQILKRSQDFEISISEILRQSKYPWNI